MPVHSFKGASAALKGSRAAFTLIELLAVIVIIGILATIIIPVTGKVREKARSVKCLSAMRQWGVALGMYLQENRDTLPKSAYGETNIQTSLGPYLMVPGKTPSPSLIATLGVGCATNNWKHGFNACLSQNPLSNVTQPTRHVYAIDIFQVPRANGTNKDNRWLTRSLFSSGSDANALGEAVPKSHSGRVSVLYVAGNVASRKCSEIMQADVTRGAVKIADGSSYWTSSDETTPIGNPEFDR
jgi:prepilin-type N-terminal cleavage/methylation domain-containing protein